MELIFPSGRTNYSQLARSEPYNGHKLSRSARAIRNVRTSTKQRQITLGQTLVVGQGHLPAIELRDTFQSYLLEAILAILGCAGSYENPVHFVTRSTTSEF